MPALAWIISFLAAWTVLSAFALGIWVPDLMTILAGLLVALGAVLMWFHRRGDDGFLRILGRGGLVLLPIILVVMIPVAWVFRADWMDVRLQQGILAGLIIASGWVATFLFQEERAQRARTDLRRDTLTALQSEIFNILSKIDNQDIVGSARIQQQKMRTGGLGPNAYLPFSTTESAPIVFDAISDSIPVLKPGTIRPVLRFYAEYEDLRSIVSDMRSDAYRVLSVDRRISVHEELTRRRKVTLRWGLTALIAVNEALGMSKGDAANISRSDKNTDIMPAVET